jgi:benzoylformate decarboxylase
MRHTDQRNPEVPQPTTVREALFEVARRLNLTTIFGNPGTTEILEDFPDDFRYVLGLQEASVVGMVNGYAQTTEEERTVMKSASAAAGAATVQGFVGSSVEYLRGAGEFVRRRAG